MQDETPQTHYLPANRLDKQDILKIAQEIAGSPAAVPLAAIPLAVAIVNETRQIVYANDRFLALTGVETPGDVLGKRPGEALGCLHATETKGGCGTTPFCRYCGAAAAIVKSLGGHRDTQECSINRGGLSTLEALNFQIWSEPMEQGGRRLVLNSILDIAHEKSLRGFERIFFHDIMNAVSGIKGIHELIALDLPSQHAEDIALLRKAIDNIQDIVESQRDFLAVEAKDYVQTFSSLETGDVLTQLAAYCQAFNAGQRCTMVIADTAVARSFSSDPRLVQRILINMVKNALEASAPGETVTLGCDDGPAGGLAFWVHNPAVLAEDVRMRLFQKGFSTKGSGRGFGTYGMLLFAQQYLGGTVDFTSDPQSGTRFFLRLPR